jgi:hypothetical protein
MFKINCGWKKLDHFFSFFCSSASTSVCLCITEKKKTEGIIGAREKLNFSFFINRELI